jgi:tape measure domain-containing protein
VSDQVVTLRINGTAAGLVPATATAKKEFGEVGEAAAQAGAKGTAAAGKIVQGTQAVGASAGAASTQLGRLGRAGSEAGDKVAEGAKRGNEGLKQMVREASQAQFSVKSIVQSAAQLAGIAIGANLVRSAVQMADGYTNLSSKIRNVVDDESALSRVRQSAFDIAQNTRQDLAATAELYTSLTRSTQDLGLAESQRLRITETINKSFVISGASAGAANAAIVQLSQGLASGALRGDEFNSVAEQAPILMDLLARSLGKTRGELREMAAEGLITADVLATALLQGSAEVDRQFQNMALTVGASTTQLVNGIQRWLGSSSEGIGASALLAESISLVARNIDPLADMVVGLALAWSTKYVVSLVAAKAASMAQLQQTVALTAAELVQAQASEAGALALANKQRSMVALTGSTGAAIAAEQAYATAQARTAAAATASAAATAANVGLLSKAGTGLMALAGGPWGLFALAVGAAAVATYGAIQAENKRIQEFEDGIASTLAAADATEQLVDSLTRVGDVVPPSLAERFAAEAEAIAKLTAEQERLNAAREAAARTQLLDNSLLAGQRVEGLSGQVDAEFDRIQRLESATAKLADQTLRLSRANIESLGPAIDAMTEKFGELEEAGNGRWLDELQSLGSRVGAAFAAGRSELDAMNAAYRAADGIAATLTANAKKAGEELANLGKTESERALAQLESWEESVRASGALTEAQIAAKRLELEASSEVVAALEREKEALKGRAAAGREADRAQREQIKTWNDALRANQSFTDKLEDLRAEMGGPLAQAQLRHQRALREMAQLAREAGVSTDELAEAQALLGEQFGNEFVNQMKAAAQAAKEGTKEIGRSYKDVLAELEDTSLSRLLKDIELVEKALKSAMDPKLTARLEAGLEQLQGRLGEVQGSLALGIVDATSAALKGMQSLTENGSKAFKEMQVAIDALALVQGILAILNQGAGEPMSAPFRMAAMAVAIAPLIANLAGSIGAFGGSSGFSDTAAERQATQGTGTVLGAADEQSQSIQNALDIIADATSQLPGLSRGMLQALQSLQGGLDRAGGMLARGAAQADFEGVPGAFNFGSAWMGGMFGSLADRVLDPLGILGGRSRVTDQGIAIGGGSLDNLNVQAYQEQQYTRWRFGRTRTREEMSPVAAEFEAQFQLIVDSLVDTVRQGAMALGMLPDEIDAALERYRLEETRISLKDLSAEEQQAELLAVLSSIFDGVTGSVVPYITQFQRLGEGLGETLVRVATGVMVTREALLQLGFSLDETDPERFAQISEGLIEMTGGIENFITGMQSFVEAFAPEAHRFEVAQSELNRAFAEAGLVLPQTREGMWALMQSLDATTEAGQAQIATLLRLSGSASAYYDMLDRRGDEERQAIEALQAHMAALADYRADVQALRDELADVGMTPLARELRDIDRWANDARAALHDAARAAGMQGAAEEDLGLVHQVAAQRAAAAIAQLRDAAADLVAELYGTPLDEIEAEIERIERAQQEAQQSQIEGIEAVGQAATNVYASQLSALQGIQAWLDSQALGDLSTLTPAQRQEEAQRQFDATLAAAQAGDTDALQAITGQADALLRQGMSYFGTPDYMALEASVRSALQGLVDRGPLGSPDVPGSTGSTGSIGSVGNTGGAPVSPELQALYDRRDALLDEQLAAQRAETLRELGGMIRELIQATGEPLADVAESIGLNLTSLATDLGINLDELSAETALSLVGLARQLGVDVAQLAASVGVELGALADRQSLLNAALDATLADVPQDLRAQLEGPLEAIRSATNDADATSAVEAAEAAINKMPQGIRDLLAPFFAGIGPGPIVSELSTLRTISSTASEQLASLRGIRTTLGRIARGETDVEEPEGDAPSYDVGTGYVPRTGMALIHQGEAILPAPVADFARRSGLQIGAASGGDSAAVVAELRALRDEQRRAADDTALRLERVERAQREGSNDIAREQRRTGDLIQQRG